MDESFLPYAMLEPLLEEGMTASQLARKVVESVGLGYGHDLYNIEPVGRHERFKDAIKAGVRIVKHDPKRVKSGWGQEPVR